MTGLHYIIREKRNDEGELRVFRIRRSDQTHRKNIDVWLDEKGTTHCGSCVGAWIAMARNCAHCDAVKRFVASDRAGPSREGSVAAERQD